MQPEKSISDAGGRSTHAFTLMELIVIIAVLLLLALCLLPALARTNPDTRAFQCLNNQRQLVHAWRMYADDNQDKVVGAYQGGSATPPGPGAAYDAWAVAGPWAAGWLTWGTDTANTNTLYVADSRYAFLARYFGNDPQVVQCPADQFVSAPQRARGWKRRARSVSSNICVGGANADEGPFDATLTVVKKYTDLTYPKPAETWLFIDEHPDSMNDPVMWTPTPTQWIDLPGNLHDGGASVAFADGSAEIHRWQGIVLNLRIGFFIPGSTTTGNDPDATWLRARTPRKPGVN